MIQTDRERFEAQGFTVDKTCSPWVAYKGPRFNPTEWHTIRNDNESVLADALLALLAHYKQLVDSGDAGNWDCETETEVIDARAALAYVQP